MSGTHTYNLGQAFHETVRAFPSAPSLRFLDGTTLDYAGLDDLSTRTANWLLDRGISRGSVVAIFHEKTAHAYGLMLGCLKAGAAYTNLDPSSPPERLRKMLDVCRPSLVCVGERNGSLVASAPVLDYSSEAFHRDLAGANASFPAANARVTGQDPAYIMFTSGSTGFPKGAVMSHSNVLRFIEWSRATFGVSPADGFTNLNPMHFDNSVFDFYSSLFTGASMTPVPEALLREPRRLLDALKPMGCSIWFSVPSLLVYVLKMRALRSDDLPSVRTVSFGGEGFPKAQLRVLHQMLGDRVQLVNVYGPTECTCICSSYTVRGEDLAADELLPLGPVAPDFDFVVIDERHEPVPAGNIGELCLGGPQVGLGYYREAEKTRAAFIQDPRHQNFRAVFYRTGDLVRYDAERDLLHFSGRRDNQVKRMGYRIELEEIESALGALPYVEENGVVFAGRPGEGGRIVACVSSRNRDEAQVVADLRNALPPYMIPDRFVFLDALPKNANGKIDRGALRIMKEVECRI